MNQPFIETGECYGMEAEVFIDRRRPLVEAQPYMRWRTLINAFLFSLPIWAVIIGLFIWFRG